MKRVSFLAHNKAIAIITLAILVLLTIGLSTKIHLGDEIHHFKHAVVIYNSKERPTIDPDPIYQRSKKVRVNYRDAVLWHNTLAFLWKITGGVSSRLAQIYHCCYLIILAFSVYILGKELFGKEVGVNSVFVLISTPMVIVFAVLFYMEIPVLALSTLSVVLITKRKYLFAGLTFGLAVLTKLNAILFLPGAVIFIFCYSDKKWEKRLVNMSLFCLMVSLVNLPDALFRYKTWGHVHLPIKKVLPIEWIYSLGNLTGGPKETGNLPKIDTVEISNTPKKDESIRVLYSPSSLYNPFDIVTYFGIALLILFLLYIILKKYERKDSILWIIISSYAIFYLYFFVYRVAPTLPDIRYLMPIIPFVIILGTKALVSLSHRTKTLVLVLCALQFIGTSGFIYSKRYIPKDLERGFDFIRDSLPQDSLLLYPEVNVRYYSKRLSIWTGVTPLLRELLWSEDKTRVLNILSENTIDYIVVKKSRIHNAAEEGYTGGFPKIFVDRLPTFSFLELIFENSEMSIWQVDKIKSRSLNTS